MVQARIKPRSDRCGHSWSNRNHVSPRYGTACRGCSTAWQRPLDLSAPEELNELRTINRCGRRHAMARAGSFRPTGNVEIRGLSEEIDGEVAARALADRSLLRREGKNLTCKVTIPEHGRPRVYVVSGTLLEGDAD